MKSMLLIPVAINRCPSLRLRLGLAAPKLYQELRKFLRGPTRNLVTQREAFPSPFVSPVSVETIPAPF